MNKTRRLLTILLIAVSLFTAAMPALAVEDHWISVSGGSEHTIGPYYGSSVSYYVGNQGYTNVYWELQDSSGIVLDSGWLSPYVAYDDKYTYSNTLNVSDLTDYYPWGPSEVGFKLMLSCAYSVGSSCAAEGNIVVN
ncbi:hypothetical protein WBG83_21490 [Paenibacillus sp. y28]